MVPRAPREGGAETGATVRRERAGRRPCGVACARAHAHTPAPPAPLAPGGRGFGAGRVTPLPPARPPPSSPLADPAFVSRTALLLVRTQLILFPVAQPGRVGKLQHLPWTRVCGDTAWRGYPLTGPSDLKIVLKIFSESLSGTKWAKAMCL